MPIFIIGEIGVNHNGDIDIAKRLIDGAVRAGCDAVKFQKRTVEAVYSPDELDRFRESPWGKTNREQKLGLEFGRDEYDEIDRYCRSVGIDWFCSAWDLESVEFLRRYGLKYSKVPSAMLTHRRLVEEVAKDKRHTFVSTGMSTLEEIDRAVEVLSTSGCPFELMHCNSSYPMPTKDANLRTIQTLKERYKCPVGYSGHEVGLPITLAAAALGASSIERHITLDRAMYGSDQAASVEIPGLIRLVRDIRAIELALGDGIKTFTDGEREVRAKLASPYWARQAN